MKFIATLVLAVVSVSVLADSQIQENDWAALLDGEVIIESVENSAGVPGVRALFVVTASRQKIWHTLRDYDNFSRIFDGLDKLQVLEENQSGAHVEFWIDAVLKNLHYVLYRKYSVEGVRIDWSRVSGDLKTIQGSWHIKETTTPNKKLIIYESYVDIGYSVITWAIRMGAKSKAKKMAYRLRQWLEQPKQ